MTELSIEELAYQTRLEFGAGEEAPIGDIKTIILEAEYDYKEEFFSDDFSAFTQYIGNYNYLIGFNLNHYYSENYKRFTLAHEIGHIHIPAHNKILQTKRMHRSRPEFISNNLIEKEADHFAINFLAPRRSFINYCKHLSCKIEDLEKISNHYKISFYATCLRFIELTHLSCILIVCNKDGVVEYERRSNNMRTSLYHTTIRGSSMKHQFSLMRKNNIEFSSEETSLSSWYNNLPGDVPTDEIIIYQPYNKKYLVLLEPHFSDISEYLKSDEY